MKSGGQLPSISIALSEQHVGRRIDDPAAQTEIEGVLAELGFKVVEAKKKSQADVQLSGEGISEFATRKGDLISVRGRVEIKATRRGVLLFSDRQSTIAVGLSEAVTSKDTLQAAAATLIDRIVPQLLKSKK